MANLHIVCTGWQPIISVRRGNVFQTCVFVAFSYISTLSPVCNGETVKAVYMESFWKMEIKSLTSTVDLSAVVQTTIVQSRISCWCDLLFLIISFNNDVIYSSVVRHCGHHPIQGELLHLLCLASLKKGYHAGCEGEFLFVSVFVGKLGS